MKKLIAALLLSLASAVAFALPSPHQIEDALKQGDLNSARSMVHEVLREKPESAKAHLFNAYILAKQGDRSAAQLELQNAKRFDHSGSVQNSALYGRTVATLEAPVAPVKPSYKPAATSTPEVTYSSPVATPTQPEKPSAFWGFLKFMFWVSVIGLIAYVIYYWYSKKQAAKKEKEAAERAAYRSAMYPRSTASTSGFSAPYGSSTTASYESRARHSDVVHAAPATGGTTIVNNGSHGGSGDMVTGLMLGHMMSGHGSHHHHDHGHSHGSNHSSASASAPTPVAAPAVDYDSRSSSFSSGNGDSWTSSRSSSSSSDDDWGSRSSSYSSSSSSSSWDSGSSSSSYDSGSSSSGSDW